MLERQKALYEALEDVYAIFGGDKWVAKEWLVNHVNIVLGREAYILNTRPEAHDVCSMLNFDMDEINSSGEYDKYIILKNNEFKIATKKELLEEYEKRKKKLITEATKMGLINKKLESHGQGQIFDVDKFKESYFK